MSSTLEGQPDDSGKLLPCVACGHDALEPFSGWLTRCKWCGHVASTKTWNRRPTPSADADRVREAAIRAAKAAVMLYDKWENGDPCYEDPESCTGPMGNAFRLWEEEEKEVLEAIEEFEAALATPAPKPGEGGELERHREAIRQALNELGVPGPGYPAPVAEAVRILTLALCNGLCPPCDMGENTKCLCPPQAPTAPASAPAHPEAPEVCEVCGKGELSVMHELLIRPEEGGHYYRPAKPRCTNPDCKDGMVQKPHGGGYVCPRCNSGKQAGEGV